MHKGKSGSRDNTTQRERPKRFSPQKPKGDLPTDPDTLIHELRVHQIELEAQNEELRRAQTELEESRSRYTDLYDFAPVAFLSLDKHGLIKEANFATTDLLGVERGFLKNRPFVLFLDSRESRDMFYHHLRHTYMTGTKQICELVVKRKHAAPFPARMESIASEADGDGAIRTILTDVTEYKRTEALQKDYRDLVENAHNIILKWKPTKEITFLNRFALSFFGYSKEEIIGKDVRLLVPNRDSLGCDLTDLVDTILRSPEQYVVNENENVRKNGERVWVQWTNSVSRDAAGNILEVLAIGNDITERKQAENALAESETRFHSLFENMAEGVCLHRVIYDENGIPVNYEILAVNPQYERILGIDRKSIIHKMANEVYGTAEPPYLAEFSGVGVTGTPYQFETYFPPMDKHFHVSVAPMGKDMFATVFFDITRARKAEEDLFKSNQRLSAIMDALPVGLSFSDDATCERITGNPALLAQFEVDSSDNVSKSAPDPEAPGRRVRFFREGHEITDADLPLQRAVLENRGIPPMELEVVLSSGKRWFTEASGAPVRDAEGRVIGGIAVTVDITTRKEAERALHNAKEELEQRIQERTVELTKACESLQQEMEARERVEEELRQTHKMEAIGTLAGGIAHDFNNILAAIIGFTEMALEDVSDRPWVEKYLANVLKSGRRGKELVKQILTFSRKTTSERSLLALTPILTETIQLLRASIPATVGIAFSATASSDTVLASPVEIQQILMNLATNASLAMRENGGTMTVSVTDIDFQPDSPVPGDEAPAECLQLVVQDTGVGMSSEVMRRVFEPFYTTREVGEGSGMGLAVVYGIVKDLRGTVTVESEQGVGSTFRVLLPKAGTRAGSENIQLSQVPRGSERILFVDDEEMLAEWGKSTLERLGYMVIALTDSKEALGIFSSDPFSFDLVVTDQAMPQMDGVRLAKKLLTVRNDIPVVLCTGHSDVISSERARKMGIREFLMKPLSRDEIATAIRRALDAKGEA